MGCGSILLHLAHWLLPFASVQSQGSSILLICMDISTRLPELATHKHGLGRALPAHPAPAHAPPSPSRRAHAPRATRARLAPRGGRGQGPAATQPRTPGPAHPLASWASGRRIMVSASHGPQWGPREPGESPRGGGGPAQDVMSHRLPAPRVPLVAPLFPSYLRGSGQRAGVAERVAAPCPWPFSTTALLLPPPSLNPVCVCALRRHCYTSPDVTPSGTPPPASSVSGALPAVACGCTRLPRPVTA